MPPADFPAWAERSRDGYVEQQVRSGALAADDAVAYAARQQSALLPLGLATPGHHVWVVRADGEQVGHLWLQVRTAPGGQEAYVYDVELEPRARGRGLGRATMLAAEAASRTLGARRVRLSVFGHNTPAIRLYDSLGYAVVDTLVSLRLRDADPAPYDGPGAVSLRRLPQVNPGHEVWTAYEGQEAVGSVCLHLADRSAGLHADGHDLTVAAPGWLPAVLAACRRHCCARGAVTLALSVPDPDVLRATGVAGFEVTAQLREKPLTA